MKIFFYTYYFPYPVVGGISARSYNLIKYLSRKHDVHLFSLSSDYTSPEDIRHMEQFCAIVKSFAVPDKNSSWNFVKSCFGDTPYKMLNAYNENIHAELLRTLGRDNYDLIYFDHHFLAGYQLMPYNHPRILCYPNLEHRILANYGNNLMSIRGWYGRLQAGAMKSFELNVSKRFNGVICVSQLEEDILKSYHPSINSVTITNGVDVNLFRPRNEEKTKPDHLIFFGNFTYYPNVEAVHFFMRTIFPHIKSKYPRVTLDVVGVKPPKTISAYADANVKIVGRVENIQEWINKAAVVVVPLKNGGGTKLKVAEAMAMGKAIVTTSVGVEGLPVKNSYDLLIADKPHDFANKVCIFLNSPGTRIILGQRARVTAVKYLSWDRCGMMLENFFAGVIDKGMEKSDKPDKRSIIYASS